MKRQAMIVWMCLLAMAVSAQTYLPNGAQEAIRSNRYLAGANYLSYANQYGEYDHTLTPAPEGYEAFYVSTYARHGSRWLTEVNQYTMPIAMLQRADSLKQLTKEGKCLLDELKVVRAMAPDEKMGVLTAVGAEQHIGVAERMCRNFPEVFNDKAVIDARSSAVARCVKSMAEEVETIQRMAGLFYIPQHCGTPEIQNVLASWDPAGVVREARKPADGIVRAYREKHTPIDRLQKLWFRSTDWTDDKEVKALVRAVFDLAGNMQSHGAGPDLFRYFTAEECYQLWTNTNVEWYLKHAYAPQTKGLLPYKEQNLMRDFVEQADRFLEQKGRHGATLRFGHDGCILPLMCLMEVEGVNVRVADLDTLDRVWRNYEIIPMAANVQVVFYRPISGKGEVLIRVLMNEREMHLPLEAVQGVYYRWSEVRELWMGKWID